MSGTWWIVAGFGIAVLIAVLLNSWLGTDRGTSLINPWIPDDR